MVSGGKGYGQLAGQTAQFNQAAGLNPLQPYSGATQGAGMIGGGASGAAGASASGMSAADWQGISNNSGAGTLNASSYNPASGYGAIGKSAESLSFNLPKAAKSPGWLDNTLNKVGGAVKDVAGKAALGGLLSPSGIAGAAATPPGQQMISPESYNTIRSILGEPSLPSATEEQLNSYVSMPLSELQNQFSFNFEPIKAGIQKSYGDQRAAWKRQFAQSGQNMMNSSDLQKKMTELDQLETQDIAQAQQEMYNLELSQAIQAKQWALSEQLRNNQYNSGLAMELAKMRGNDLALQNAIANNDYDTFQSIMADILNAGFLEQGGN
jgi:hypothetical protein